MKAIRRSVSACLLGAIFVAAPALAQFSGPGEAIPPAPADLIIEDAHVLTPDGWVDAMAVSGGTIVALGGADAVARHRTADTRIVKLGGRTVLPGLHDMHVHPMGAGLAHVACAIPHGSTPGAIFARVAECAKGKAPGEWISGNGYEASSFGATPPNRQMLDKVAPNNPALFFDISGHSSWVNSAALKLAGIDHNTPDPAGGIIERDASGEPTGLLRERAAALVWTKMPPPTREQNAAALQWALATLLAQGITAFEDAGVGEKGALAYADLADKGLLKQRVRGCLMWTDPTVLPKRNLYARDRFTPSCVKMFLDGVPTDGHTAAMVEDYLPLPNAVHGDGREKGLLLVPQAKLDAEVTRLDAMGMTVKFHAAGDGAVRAALDAIVAARRANGFSGLLHNPGHNSFIQPVDIARARALGATFEFSPYIWYPSPIIGDIKKAVGEERMKRWIPVKEVLDAGVASVPGSDWPVTPSSNPWVAMETLVTRQVPGGGGEILGAAERITLKQAFDMFTRQSANQLYLGQSTGTLETGKRADFVVVDRDIFAVPITQVGQTKVLMTYIDGEKVYSVP